MSICEHGIDKQEGQCTECYIAGLLSDLETLKAEAIPYIEMLIADWSFRREQSGIEQPESPELVGAREFLKKPKGE